jgi:hypothetical protein
MAFNPWDFQSAKVYSAANDGTKLGVTTDANVLISAISITNLAAAITYLHIFDAQVGDVTVGTTVPDWVICIPASANVTIGFPDPVKHTAGLTLSSNTTAGGDTGATTFITVTYGSG